MEKLGCWFYVLHQPIGLFWTRPIFQPTFWHNLKSCKCSNLGNIFIVIARKYCIVATTTLNHFKMTVLGTRKGHKSRKWHFEKLCPLFAPFDREFVVPRVCTLTLIVYPCAIHRTECKTDTNSVMNANKIR